jgi:hypothetical protein
MEETLNEIKNQVVTLEREMTALLSGNQSAGARARKASQTVKVGCHALRKAVTEHLKETKLAKKTQVMSETPEETPEETPVVVKRKAAPKKKA